MIESLLRDFLNFQPLQFTDKLPIKARERNTVSRLKFFSGPPVRTVSFKKRNKIFCKTIDWDSKL